MALFVPASRLVGPGGTGSAWARVQVRVGCPTIRYWRRWPGAASRVLEEEVAIRRTSALPPFSALALVSGALAKAYADVLRDAAIGSGAGVTVSPLDGDRFLLRAEAHDPLCDLLTATPRPPGRGCASRSTRRRCDDDSMPAPAAPSGRRPCRHGGDAVTRVGALAHDSAIRRSLLKGRAHDVDDIDAALASLVDSMIETMYAAPGTGLAANQVGVQRRIFVYDIGESTRP